MKFSRNKKTNCKKIKKQKTNKYSRKNKLAQGITAADASNYYNLYLNDRNQFIAAANFLTVFDLARIRSHTPPQFTDFIRDLTNLIEFKQQTNIYLEQRKSLVSPRPPVPQPPAASSSAASSSASPRMFTLAQNAEPGPPRPAPPQNPPPSSSSGKAKADPSPGFFTLVQQSEPPPVRQNPQEAQQNLPSSSKGVYSVVETPPQTQPQSAYREPVRELYTLSQHAEERISERFIEKSDIDKIIGSRKYKIGNSHSSVPENVRIYTGLTGIHETVKIITSDDEIPLVITVIKDLDKFSKRALDDMEENNIFEYEILDIIDNYVGNIITMPGTKEKRMQFIKTEKGISISVVTNMTKNKIIGIRVKKVRSKTSQPYDTHEIDWGKEGCALQRTNVPTSFGIDCGRCSMSYIGIGSPASRSQLQNQCVSNTGLSIREHNEWLRINAGRDRDGNSPEIFSINKTQLRRRNIIDITLEAADRLLSPGDQVSAAFELNKQDELGIWGHIFNIAKLDYDDYNIWYVCPQTGINPGDMLLRDKLESFNQQGKIIDVNFVLLQWQNELLLDRNGNRLLQSFRTGKGINPLNKTRRQKKRKQKETRQKIKKVKINSRKIKVKSRKVKVKSKK